MLIMPRWILQDLSFEIAPNWEQHVRTLHRAPFQVAICSNLLFLIAGGATHLVLVPRVL